MNTEAFWTGIPGILTALGGLIAAVGTLIGVLHSAGLLKRKPPAAETATPSDGGQPSTGGGVAPNATTIASSTLVLRSAPAIVSSEKMSAMLVRRDFFDRRRNPTGAPPQENYEKRVDGEMLMIVDHSTGLTWEMGGSDRPMGFDEAPARMDQLNATRAGGFADWRLPTAEEATSLMRRDPVDGFHLSGDFRRGVNFIWTADLVDDGSRAWVLYFADGTIEAEAKEFNAWVRAVRSKE